MLKYSKFHYFSRIASRTYSAYPILTDSKAENASDSGLNSIKSNLPQSNQIKDLIENNSIYVDKSEQIYKLMKTGNSIISLMPKGFGNTLLISTIEAIAEKSRILENLLISKHLPSSYESSPVIKFSFTDFEDTKTSVLDIITKEVMVHSKKLDITLINDNPIMNLYDILRVYSEKYTKPYIIIDAYDTPI